ncbi:unnamed protein product [Lepeophtheirus salmonis]|uniref:(salmon louse) hypothetical protein n=1 Tax=Lepeophtheirus salmonis TaxID=72036 RepID=A0A7R8CRJ6_LEPSM|nr:unnamed protein product [Lepeophtheirus salmonis]CAF2854957.1 unnamed protein product [Lepeophtheirus salmonis]
MSKKSRSSSLAIKQIKSKTSLKLWNNFKKNHHHHHSCLSEDGEIYPHDQQSGHECHHHYSQSSSASTKTKVHKFAKSGSNSSPCSTKSSFKHKRHALCETNAFINSEIAEQVIRVWKATYKECAAIDTESINDLF